MDLLNSLTKSEAIVPIMTEKRTSCSARIIMPNAMRQSSKEEAAARLIAASIAMNAANFLAAGKFDSGRPATWNEGDFGNDGLVDILDAADLFSTGLFNAGVYNQPASAFGTVAPVPEPSCLGIVAAMAGSIVLGRRLSRREKRVDDNAPAATAMHPFG